MRAYKELFSFVWKYLQLQKGKFFTVLFVSLVWSIDATVWPYLLRVVIDIFTQYDTQRSLVWESLKIPALLGLLLWFFVDLGFRVQGFLMAKMLPKLEADLRLSMFDHIQRHSPQYFQENFAGALANKITDMTTQVSLIIQEALTLLIPSFIGSILAIIFFFEVNPIFAALLLIWIMIHFTVLVLFTKKCDYYEQIHGDVRSTLLGKIVDSLSNNFAVNLFYRFAYENAYIARFQQKEQETHYQAKRYVELMRLCLGIFTFLGCGVAINGLMILFWMKGKITTGEVIQIFNTTWSVILMNWFVGFTIPTIYQGLGLARQAFSLMRDPQDILDVNNATDLQIQKGEIIFENVSFHYEGKKLFHNKHVHIKGGEKVGLVGFSGSGKSTFVKLILRFYPLETGNILIDGQDIAKVKLASLREKVSLIPQDPMLFHRTLAENIAYGKTEAKEEEIIEAAKLAHCDEFISLLPDTYQTLVGERGMKLSGGERQRVAMARALMSQSPILILDEATSALDSVTENFVQESLEKLMANRTTIVIAHRLSTLSRMDRILVFDQGKIIEEGSHHELLAKDGHYSRMWKMQVGGFLPNDVS